MLGRGLISEEDLSLFRVTDDLETAVEEITGFYRNYHSSRYVDDLLVLRVRRGPDEEQLEALNREFSDILAGGKIEVRPVLPREAGEVDDYPRITLRFNHVRVGRLRQFIDRLNTFVGEAAPPGDASPHEIVAAELPPEQGWREGRRTRRRAGAPNSARPGQPTGVGYDHAAWLPAMAGSQAEVCITGPEGGPQER